MKRAFVRPSSDYLWVPCGGHQFRRPARAADPNLRDRGTRMGALWSSREATRMTSADEHAHLHSHADGTVHEHTHAHGEDHDHGHEH